MLVLMQKVWSNYKCEMVTIKKDEKYNFIVEFGWYLEILSQTSSVLITIKLGDSIHSRMSKYL